MLLPIANVVFDKCVENGVVDDEFRVKLRECEEISAVCSVVPFKAPIIPLIVV